MSSLLKRVLFFIFGNKIMQIILGKIAFTCEYFMGIGSGSSVGTSGEEIVFSLIKKNKPIIFDVGANQGQFALEALTNVKKTQGIVYSFEPSKKLLKL